MTRADIEQAEAQPLDPDMFEEPESLERVRKQLANAIFFQFGVDAGEGFVFLVDTPTTATTPSKSSTGARSPPSCCVARDRDGERGEPDRDSWEEYCDRPA